MGGFPVIQVEPSVSMGSIGAQSSNARKERNHLTHAMQGRMGRRNWKPTARNGAPDRSPDPAPDIMRL